MKRSFVYQKDGTQKFWIVELEGCVVRVRFGKLGSKGQVRERSQSSEKKATTDFHRSIRAKLRDGYVEVQEEVSAEDV